MKSFWNEVTGRSRRPTRRDRSMAAVRRTGRLGAIAAVGAGAMYLFDPAVGRRRRALLRDRTAGTVRHGLHHAERLSTRARAEAYGLKRKAIYGWRRAEPPANDQMLTDRVLSQVFRHPDYPRRHVNVNVQGGVVVLRGQLGQPEEIRQLEDAVRKVPGVRSVESYLHLPNTPAPNKVDVLEAD